MSNPDITAELCNSVESTIKQMVKDMRLISDNLEYWKIDWGLELPRPYENLRKHIKNILIEFQEEEQK